MNHNSISFAFFGTPQTAAEILEHLKRHSLVPSLIVTNPDRPQGRKMALTPPPVKVWAQKNHIPVLQPENPNSTDFLVGLKKTDWDIFIVVAYGAIFSQALLDIPKRGALNVHYSLLPKYRGASPVESQILADDRDVGVSLMLIDEKLDHGPIISNQRLNIKGQKYEWPPKASELRGELNAAAGELLVETLPLWMTGKIEAKPQDHSQATYTKKFTKADGEVDLSGDPYKNFLKIQALEGSIGTYFFASSSSPFQGEEPSPRGGGVKRIRVIIKSAKFRDGKLHILRIVPEGKKEMSYEEFRRGLK